MSRIALYGIVLTIITVLGFALVTPVPVEAQAVWRGPYVGAVVFTEEPDRAIAVEKMITGEYDLIFDTIDTGALFKRIRDAGLPYTVSYGLYYEITVNYACKVNETTGEVIEPVFPNPSKLPRPEVEGKILFNPFCNRRIRYALHFLVNRELLSDKIAEGLAVPRYTAITPNFPDYGRLYDAIIEIERELAYDFTKARTIIFEEMPKMGAEFRDGKWYYKGEPVILIFLIRTEDIRKPIGDYISTQLERLGFTVLRFYGTAAMLAPYWIAADPYDGTMHLYTGGWITTVVARDQSGNFGFFYTKLGRAELLWQRIINTPRFFEVAEKLWNNEFKTLEERRELMVEALKLSVTVENQRIFIINRVGVWARRPNIVVASDLAGGVSGAWLWPWTIRFTDRTGAALRDSTVRVGYSQLLVEPWNPIGGSNWIFDMTIIRATSDTPYLPDPYSGLYWNHRIKRAEVYVQKDLPVFKTLDWVVLHRVENITVPGDVWLFYDCQGKKIWTRSEAAANPNITVTLFNVTYDFTEAPLVKTVVYYDDALFRGAYRWHDNSTFHIADFVHIFIITFDRACIGSPLYDAAYIPAFRSWFPTFKGFKIVSVDPLVIEYYTTVWYMDAEWIAGGAAAAFWPVYSQGPGPWHGVELFAQGERAGIVAFTAAKSRARGVPRANYLSPLPAILTILDENINRSYIPYPEVLSEFMNATVARVRWENLKRWYTARGHLWVGNGPFYLHSFVTAAPKRVEIRAYRDHIDMCDKYAFLAEPPVPVISATVPSTIRLGEPVEIFVELTDATGMPYKQEYVEFVSYVIIHPRGVISGRAMEVGGGLWKVELTPEITEQLPPGSIEIRIVAVSRIVGIPAMDTRVVTVVYPPERLFEAVEDVREDITRTIGNVTSELEGRIDTRLTQTESALRTVVERSAQAQSEEIRDTKTRVDSLTTLVYAVLAIVVINLALAGISLIRKK